MWHRKTDTKHKDRESNGYLTDGQTDKHKEERERERRSFIRAFGTFKNGKKVKVLKVFKGRV